MADALSVGVVDNTTPFISHRFFAFGEWLFSFVWSRHIITTAIFKTKHKKYETFLEVANDESLIR